MRHYGYPNPLRHLTTHVYKKIPNQIKIRRLVWIQSEIFCLKKQTKQKTVPPIPLKTCNQMIWYGRCMKKLLSLSKFQQRINNSIIQSGETSLSKKEKEKISDR